MKIDISDGSFAKFEEPNCITEIYEKYSYNIIFLQGTIIIFYVCNEALNKNYFVKNFKTCRIPKSKFALYCR